MLDLKSSSFEKLIWQTQDGFSVQPYYAEEDLAANRTFFESCAHVQKTTPGWIKYVDIQQGEEHIVNQKALLAIRQGATGLLFNIGFNTIPKFNIVLNGIDPSAIHISFKLQHPSAKFIKAYFDYIKKSGISLSQINGFCACDILAHWNITGIIPDFNELRSQLIATHDAPGFFGLGLQSHEFVKAGSTASQELAFTLNKIADYIENLSDKKLSASDVINELHIHASISSNYFFEIAKIRSLRLLWATLLTCYGEQVRPIQILSSTSPASILKDDSNINMISNTTEAMSAVLGGCDALLINSHTPEETDFSTRIALNVSNLLESESYFNKVVDPSEGSYYIESLTRLLSEKALSIFKEIENEGGYLKVFDINSIQKQIEIMNSQRKSDKA